MSTQSIDHINITPEKLGGRAHIAGRRILVADIVQAHIGADWPAAKIAEQLDLSLGQVYAALSYYYDHQDMIEQELREEDNVTRQLQQEYPSLLDG